MWIMSLVEAVLWWLAWQRDIEISIKFDLAQDAFSYSEKHWKILHETTKILISAICKKRCWQQRVMILNASILQKFSIILKKKIQIYLSIQKITVTSSSTLWTGSCNSNSFQNSFLSTKLFFATFRLSSRWMKKMNKKWLLNIKKWQFASIYNDK